MKKLLTTLFLIVTIVLSFSLVKVSAESYLSDKTEIPINLEVPGVEALCQTEDGFVWIAQYSGLIRYDSKEFVTYKEFEEDGKKYDIINVRELVSKGNTLYIATSTTIYKYEDNKFSNTGLTYGAITDIQLDKENDLLYVSSSDGLYIYNTKTKEVAVASGTKDYSVTDSAFDNARNAYYYVRPDGVYSSSGVRIFVSNKVLDIHIYQDTLLIGVLDGGVYRYDLVNNVLLDDYYHINDQVNKILYSEVDKTIFVACENDGVYCIDEPTGKISVADNLSNKSQLVDLMVDYEGNLWVASHYIGSSGVSIITKNALVDLFYDDEVWQQLPQDSNRNIYAVERIGNILYVAAKSGIYLYDMQAKQIIEDNIIMPVINNYVSEKGIVSYDFRDVEEFNNKIYFAANNIGLVEYDPSNNNIKIYDIDYIENHINNSYNEPIISVTNSIRCLRAFDNYLIIGYAKGVMRFDGTSFDVNYRGEKSVLYITKTVDGKVMFNKTEGIYIMSDDFSTATEVSRHSDDNGSALKTLVDGNNLYYSSNSRLFCIDTSTNQEREIIIPAVSGSIVEIAKVQLTNNSGDISYKYVICSETQVYIVNSLDGNILEGYDFYDASNGLKTIKANTSGFYDQENQKYYFQSTNGVFVYDFNTSVGVKEPTKIAINSIRLDGKDYYGTNLSLDKNVNRIEFNLSIFGFKPNKGHTIYYKLDGVDADYVVVGEDTTTISYTNISGGEHTFHIYVLDEYGQMSNQVEIHINKAKHYYEQIWFWVLVALLVIALGILINFLIIHHRTKIAKQRENELKSITIESIEAIARTIDAKDNYTNGHSIRVGHFSKLIAQELGMQGDELANLYYIALLHDIGKIGITDAILNKPDRLTDEEFAIMKSHTTKGAKILKDISTIPNIVEGAKYHHEKYNGSGYPDGLKGEEIPYIARIICCADCYDAMATRRVYKEPYSKERMIEEFEKGKGIQFDAKIADVVIKLIKEDKMGFNG
ncbi:MAG: HD domain-containing protein [Bacilli bacterium]|nr:HD domain-containing protein [Bacilli bacterium]